MSLIIRIDILILEEIARIIGTKNRYQRGPSCCFVIEMALSDPLEATCSVFIFRFALIISSEFILVNLPDPDH